MIDIAKSEQVRDFLAEMKSRFGIRLKDIILFGSRARGDAGPDSDYDFLAVFDEVSPEITDGIDEIAGEMLNRHGLLFAVIPVSEEDYRNRTHDPLMMNVRREGVVL
jgi:predicted nucleotidyltransferase